MDHQNKEQRDLCSEDASSIFRAQKSMLMVFSVLSGPPPGPLAAGAGLFCNIFFFFFLLHSPSSLGPRDV